MGPCRSIHMSDCCLLGLPPTRTLANHGRLALYCSTSTVHHLGKWASLCIPDGTPFSPSFSPLLVRGVASFGSSGSSSKCVRKEFRTSNKCATKTKLPRYMDHPAPTHIQPRVCNRQCHFRNISRARRKHRVITYNDVSSDEVSDRIKYNRQKCKENPRAFLYLYHVTENVDLS